MKIRPFQRTDERAVIQLWQRAGLTRPWNDPQKDIKRKLCVQSEWFKVVYTECVKKSLIAVNIILNAIVKNKKQSPAACR